uniref:DUF7880 domain-containing protein n=1 Tax=Ananas comosus var. bracteatus TaxID=296719 RepID=A0A6V7Q4A2_ANACO|nr:unnamed protein product [Ananas comosus var. bracteatus]
MSSSLPPCVTLLRGASHRPTLPPFPTSIHRRLRLRRRTTATSSSPPPPPPPHHGGRSTRRAASSALLLLLLGGPAARPHRADAGNPFDKYVKRKKLEPLEAYIPAVLLTQAQFEDLEKYLDLEQPNYDESRSLLRSGPAASLRVNIRAVAQYATDSGQGNVASDAVDQCLRALEDLDSLLLHALRKDPTASVESMKSKIRLAVGALDSLLQTVPSTILDKGKAIADAYRIPSDGNEGKLEDMNPEMKQLDGLL